MRKALNSTISFIVVLAGIILEVHWWALDVLGRLLTVLDLPNVFAGLIDWIAAHPRIAVDIGPWFLIFAGLGSLCLIHREWLFGSKRGGVSLAEPFSSCAQSLLSQGFQWADHLGHRYRGAGGGLRPLGLQFSAKNVSGHPIQLDDAYIVSGVTGMRADVEVAVDGGWTPASTVNAIPPNSTLVLGMKFNLPEGLAAQEVIDAWGTMHLYVSYEDTKHQIPITENMVRAVYAGFQPNPIGPRVTRRIAGLPSPNSFQS